MIVDNNEVFGMRDGIYFEFVTESKVHNNNSHDNVRYGLHFMFSNNDTYENNEFSNNGAGVAVMFSKKIQMFSNTFKNNWGTAPGMWFNSKSKVIISLPGVPNEMKGLMQDSVLPKLIKTFKLPFIIHKTIITYGMGESMVAARIEDWENNLPKFIKLAYLPSFGNVRLRLSAKGTNYKVLKSAVKSEVEKLVKIISDIIIGLDEDEKKRKKQVADTNTSPSTSPPKTTKKL